MTTKQDELTAKHGTPAEFSKAVWQACNDLWITPDEAVAGIRKYESEWYEAGRQEALG